MTNTHTQDYAIEPELTEHKIAVLLVDDQAMIGEGVRRMLAAEQDIVYHYCNDATLAVKTAMSVSATIILQDISMPQIDGLTLAKFFRANAATRDIPLIVLSSTEDPEVKAKAFSVGANDYLVKFPDKIELIARIRYHSKCYINLLQRNEAFQALIDSQKALAAELAEAAEYVISLLPARINSGGVDTKWSFVPSTQLGGDSFGYHWLDQDNFALYLIDVCGHGVGAALLSISVMKALSSQSLPGADYTDPGNVLGVLNETYKMEDHNNMFFSIWYGVFNKPERKLAFASGGHPPGVLITDSESGRAKTVQLKTNSPLVGSFPDVKFESDECLISKQDKLYIYSDGVYEVPKPDGSILSLDEFVDIVVRQSQQEDNDLDCIKEEIVSIQGSTSFDDDYSILRIIFT